MLESWEAKLIGRFLVRHLFDCPGFKPYSFRSSSSEHPPS